jgi:hypothetical protein
MNIGTSNNARTAYELYKPLAPLIQKHLDAGLSYSDIAREFNRMGIRNNWDNEFSRQMIHLLISRLKKQGLL